MEGLAVKFSQVLIVGFFVLSTLGTIQVFHEELLCRRVGFAEDGCEGVLTSMDVFCKCGALMGVSFYDARETTVSYRAMKDTKCVPHDWHHVCTNFCHRGVASEVCLQDGVDTVETLRSSMYSRWEIPWSLMVKPVHALYSKFLNGNKAIKNISGERESP
eukprot:15365585-Ditylum_brightwellii.AAC.1